MNEKTFNALPLVYSRAKVRDCDYRYFVLPEGLGKNDREKLTSFLKNVINTDNPLNGEINVDRWSVLRLSNWVILGIGVMVENLGLDRRYSHDESNRSIRAFIGISVHINEVNQGVSSRQLREIFKMIFTQYVDKYVKDMSRSHRSLLILAGNNDTIKVAFTAMKGGLDEHPFNLNQKIVRVFPKATSVDMSLNMALLECRYQVNNFSVVFGLNVARHAANSRFMNAFCDDVDTRRDVSFKDNFDNSNTNTKPITSHSLKHDRDDHLKKKNKEESLRNKVINKVNNKVINKVKYFTPFGSHTPVKDKRQSAREYPQSDISSLNRHRSSGKVLTSRSYEDSSSAHMKERFNFHGMKKKDAVGGISKKHQTNFSDRRIQYSGVGEGLSSLQPQVSVRLVTAKEYCVAFNVKEPEYAEGSITLVSWEQAKRYCALLSIKKGERYRLPFHRELEKIKGDINSQLWEWCEDPVSEYKEDNNSRLLQGEYARIFSARVENSCTAISKKDTESTGIGFRVVCCRGENPDQS